MITKTLAAAAAAVMFVLTSVGFATDALEKYCVAPSNADPGNDSRQHRAPAYGADWRFLLGSSR